MDSMIQNEKRMEEYHNNLMDREDAQNIPILALSANAFEDDVQRSLDAGMNAHLTKPLDIRKIISELQEVLKEKRKNMCLFI